MTYYKKTTTTTTTGKYKCKEGFLKIPVTCRLVWSNYMYIPIT